MSRNDKLVEAGEYLRQLLQDAVAGRPIRDMAEAIGTWDSARIEALASPKGAEPDNGLVEYPTPRNLDAEKTWGRLECYRAAVSYLEADSWDGCPDCIDILKMARAVDFDLSWTSDQTAKALQRLRVRAGYAEPFAHPPASPTVEADKERIAALEDRLAEIMAFRTRVLAAVDYVPPATDETRERIAADLAEGMSLRQCAKKHGVGVGVVRGVARTTLENTND